jgi:hypothetical protein
MEGLPMCTPGLRKKIDFMFHVARQYYRNDEVLAHADVALILSTAPPRSLCQEQLRGAAIFNVVPGNRLA